MKLLSFGIPSYNSEAYVANCIESLLVGGEDVEIIVVNDGSKDRTSEIAHEYANKYPTIVKVIDKENGGHGSGVNAGLKAATGLYYKVVDSDDWANAEALTTLLNTIKKHLEEGALPDLYINNFVYEHVEDNTFFVRSYKKYYKENQTITWNEVKPMRWDATLLMHALVYKREVLIESGLELPHHTFYVDNLFAYQPLAFVKTIHYIDIDLYRYFIGRADQSVNVKNLVRRYEQQLRVMKLIVSSFKYEDIKKMNKGLRQYLLHCINAINLNGLFFTCADDSPERRAALKDYWQFVKEHDKKMYNFLRYRSYSTLVNFLPWKLKGAILTYGYKVLQKKVKLG